MAPKRYGKPDENYIHDFSTIVGDIRTVSGLRPPYDVVSSISVVEHAGPAKYGETGKASGSRETFGLKDGAWIRMKPEQVEKIPLRNYATGMAFLRLRKP
jgi:hypothetical protein